MITEAEKGYFGLGYSRFLVFPSAAPPALSDLKPLIKLRFCRQQGLAAGEFAVYKKGRLARTIR